MGCNLDANVPGRPIVVLQLAVICNFLATYIKSKLPISFASDAITSELIPLPSFRISSPVILLSKIFSRSSPMVSFLICSYCVLSRSSRIILVTLSFSYSTAGEFVTSSTVSSDKTYFAAMRSLAFSAPIPASVSPLFCSLALASTSFTEPNS